MSYDNLSIECLLLNLQHHTCTWWFQEAMHLLWLWITRLSIFNPLWTQCLHMSWHHLHTIVPRKLVIQKSVYVSLYMLSDNDLVKPLRSSGDGLNKDLSYLGPLFCNKPPDDYHNCIWVALPCLIAYDYTTKWVGQLVYAGGEGGVGWNWS